MKLVSSAVGEEKMPLEPGMHRAKIELHRSQLGNLTYEMQREEEALSRGKVEYPIDLHKSLLKGRWVGWGTVG